VHPVVIIILFIKPLIPQESGTLHDRSIFTIMSCYINMRLQSSNMVHTPRLEVCRHVIVQVKSYLLQMVLSPCYALLAWSEGQNRITVRTLTCFTCSSHGGSAEATQGCVGWPSFFFNGLFSLFVFDILQIRGGCKISKTVYGPARGVAEYTRKWFFIFGVHNIRAEETVLISCRESEGRKGPDEVRLFLLDFVSNFVLQSYTDFCLVSYSFSDENRNHAFGRFFMH